MIGYHEITQEHMKEPSLATLNSLLRQIVESYEERAGLSGTVPMFGDVDMQGHRITNLGSPVDSGDAVRKGTVEASFVGKSTLQKSLEATGNNVLQTARRLNDNTQREQFTTFLNDTGIGLSKSNTSQVSVVAAGANSDITLSAGNLEYADKSKISYAQRIDTVANPGAGSDYYYYFYNLKTRLVELAGPYSADTQQNRLNANRDGYAFLAAAKVNAGGGGSGGGGDDPPGDGYLFV